MEPGLWKDWNQYWKVAKTTAVFLCPSPMLSMAHLLHFSLCRPLSWLSSPGYYAECVPSSQVYVLQSPPGERFTQSIFVFYSLSFISLLPHSLTPTHPYQSPNSYGRDSGPVVLSPWSNQLWPGQPVLLPRHGYQELNLRVAKAGEWKEV